MDSGKGCGKKAAVEVLDVAVSKPKLPGLNLGLEGPILLGICLGNRGEDVVSMNLCST